MRTIKLQTIKLDCHPSFNIQRTKKYSIEILSFLYSLVWKTDQMILEDVMQIDPVFLEEVLGIGLFTQFTICKCTAHFELRISCYKLTHRGFKDPLLDSWDIFCDFTYGRKSADRTEPHFGVIFFVFLSTFFGNLEVCDVKTCNIFWKYMSATWSTCLCLDHYFIGGLFNCPYILCPYMGVKCMGN